MEENGTVSIPNVGQKHKYQIDTYCGEDLIYSDSAVLTGTGGAAGTYLDDVSNANSIVLLQSHWDSGVKFKNFTIRPPQDP